MKGSLNSGMSSHFGMSAVCESNSKNKMIEKLLHCNATLSFHGFVNCSLKFQNSFLIL